MPDTGLMQPMAERNTTQRSEMLDAFSNSGSSYESLALMMLKTTPNAFTQSQVIDGSSDVATPSHGPNVFRWTNLI